MKKQLLFISSVFVSGVLCAQVAKKVTKIPSNLANISAVKSDKSHDNTNLLNTSYQAKAFVASTKSAQRVSVLSQSTIGNTYYDLQSNSSVGDRIVVNRDGSIAACWTMEAIDAGTTYPNRGTGYNYFDGTTWLAAPTTRVENARVGWGNVVNTRSGRELIISHNGSAAKTHLASRSTKGTGTWVNSTTTIPSANAAGNFWPRLVTSSVGGGDTVYAISVTQSTATAGSSLYQGLNGAVCFSRSLNAGVTWDILNVVPAGLTSATFLGHGGDAYAIVANGSTVAIVAGDSGKDLVLSKSTDAGATWTSTTIWKYPVALYNPETTISDINNDGIADTVLTNDGNLAIALDNNNKAYVAYGRMRILNDAPAAGSNGSYFPYTDGLCLWNESMPANVGGPVVAAIEDLYGDNNIFFPTPATGLLPFGNYGCSLTSYPSMAFDNSNTLYLSYSSVVDSLVSAAANPSLVRHVYLVKSCDGGLNFTNPYNIVDFLIGAEYEGMYPSMAKNIDGNIHLIYQRDFYPGYSVPPATGTDPDPQNVGSLSDIIYAKIPVGDLGNCPVLTGIKDVSSSIANLNFYPNPASTNATIDVVLNETAKLDITILNSVGQTVYSTSVSGNAGSNKVNINLTNLSAGLYFYQVKVGSSKAITKKFAVEK